MKRLLQISILLVSVLCISNAIADGSDDKDKKEKEKNIYKIPVYIGNSTIDSGLISKKAFDSLLKQGLTSKDTNGRAYTVKSFFLTFCERNIYEDAEGNLMPYTDYLSEYCFDNKLKGYQEEALLERAKKGDTVIFEDIKLVATDDSQYHAIGKPVRLIISTY